MIPGPDKIIECPNCNTPARVITIISGNNFGAKMWTDGKMIAPMLPLSPAITKCNSCSQYFWISEAKTIGSFPKDPNEALNAPADWKTAKRVRNLTEFELNEALNSGAGNTKEKEMHLRICIWQAGNDKYRSSYQNFVPRQNSVTQISAEAKHNLDCLLELLPISSPANRIMKAEILREIGKFDEAIAMLEFPFPAGYDQTAISFIRELATNNDPLVREIIDDLFC